MRLPAPPWKLAAIAAIALALPALAVAHPGADAGRHDGFLQGFVHPFSGLDHLLAMGAVGI